jgi:predicted HAD superfamily Cof-like phosphohydrolase
MAKEIPVKTWLNDVANFCEDVVHIVPPDKPTILSPERVKWFDGVVMEELDEFNEATSEGDLPGAADALVDLVYFALGRLYEMGVPADAVFDEVHRANMTKVRGVKKERAVTNDADAVKPTGWKPPDHTWLNSLSYIVIEAARIRASKTSDYDGDGIEKGDYFPFYELSHAQMIWTKALRIRSLAQRIYEARRRGEGFDPKHESYRDSLVDLINYLTYAAEDADGRLKRGGER